MPLGTLSRQQLHDLDGLLRRVPHHIVANHAVVDPFAHLENHGSEGNTKAGTKSHPLSPQHSAADLKSTQGTSDASLAPKSPALRPANSYSGVQQMATAENAVRCRFGWKLADAALYFTWLAFAPLRCPSCGVVEGAWDVSVDDEYRCRVCQAGAGGGGARDVVEEVQAENEDRMSDDDDDDGDAHDAAGGVGDASGLQAVRLLLVVLRAVDIDIPIGGYRLVLRAAVTLSQLLLLPDCDPEQHNVLRCAALYVACAVLVPAKLSFPTLQRVANCGLQWQDCVSAAEAVGTVIEDFFDDPVAHTRNLMADLSELVPPSSRLWDPARTPDLEADLAALRKAHRPERHSPDHTSAVCVIELARRHVATAAPVLSQWLEKLAAAHPKLAEELKRQPQLLEDPAGAPEGSGELLTALLCYFGRHLGMHPIEMCRMLTSSGLYGGATRADATLQNSMSCGLYPIPLMTRNSPVESPWEPLYRALHSSDRVVLTALLAALSRTPAAATELPETTKTLQAVLAKHGATSTVTLNYCLRVQDESESAFNGDYFCSSVTPDGAAFVHMTKPLSIRYRAKTLVVYLNTSDADPTARRHTEQLNSIVMPPLRLELAGSSAKLAVDLVANRLYGDRWAEAIRRLDYRADLRRRMRAAGSSQVARAQVLLAADVAHAARAGVGSNAHAPCSVDVLTTAPSLQQSYEACDLVKDVPLTAVHLGAADTKVAAAAAALQHVTEAMPVPHMSPAARGAGLSGKHSPRSAGRSPKEGGTAATALPPPATTTLTSRAGGPPPLELPPSATFSQEPVDADGMSRVNTSGSAAASPRDAAAFAEPALKQLRALRFTQFPWNGAPRELRAAVRDAADAVCKLRRRADAGEPASAALAPSQAFVSSLEATRATPRQPRPTSRFP